ncbi:hypothetical protein IAU59_000293 [Kwoniella sp. CBS 9459]
MSIHFAPQWVKPIKPSGTSLTPTTETPNNLAFGSAAALTAAAPASGAPGSRISSHSVVAPNPAVPFPALSGGRASPTTNTSSSGPNPPLSYSRVTHTPLSPNFPQDASYFPYTEPNNQQNIENGAHPFRYSRDQILALFDESKFKDRPIELVELAEGGVLVSKSVNRPVGLRDLSEIEKKLLATTIHPPPPTRRQPTHNAVNPPTTNSVEPATPNGLPSRRGVGFARGEGGAFGGGLGGKIGTIGGGLISPGGLDSKAPGALGGGFGGVSKRLGRNRNEVAGEAAAESPRSTGPNWRPARTASGSFEGVLGFGSTTPSAMTAVNPLSPNVDIHETPDAGNKGRNGDIAREKEGGGGEEEKEEEVSRFGKGGGPGWGTGQKKWRIAAGLSAPGEGDKTLEVPISNEPSSASVIATPSATPVPDRDATVLESTLTPAPPQRVNGALDVSQPPALPQPQQPEEKQDLGNVEWFYRDPNGQEQGPFTGTQMHDWYSHSYFTDDLPLRRASETSFRPLSELKTATGNAVQPFLSPIRPRQLPPNLPIPIAALQQNGHPASLPEQFRNLGVSSPVAADPRISPQPPLQSTPQQFNQGFLPERNAFSPGAYGGPGFGGNNGLGSPAAFGPAPGPGGAWNAIAPGGPRLNGPFGSIGMPSPIGQAPMPFVQPQHQQQYFSPQVGSPARGGDMFSPSVGVGAIPPSPWGIPQPHQQQVYPQHPIDQQQQQQLPHQPSPMPAWPTESAQSQQPQPEIEQAVAEALAPVLAEEQTSASAEAEVNQTESIAATAPAANEEVAPVEEKADTPKPESEVTPVQAEDSTPTSEPIAATPARAPAQSAWGQNSPAVKAPSRKASIVETSVPSTPASVAPTPAAAAKASAKAVSATTQPPSDETPVMPKTVAPATPGPTATASATATPISEKTPAVSSKPAPWALKEDKEAKTPSGPSLREIQEAEAKKAEARRVALAEARAASASPAPTPSASTDEFPTSIAWGLPSSNKGQAAAAAASPAAPSTPVMPAWGGNDAAPKKTLKQIQEEEEKRKAKAAQAARAAQAAAGAPVGQKRGYADLAATVAPASAPGWTTVGFSGKASAAAVASPAVSSPSAARVVSTPISKPATPVKSVAAVIKKDEGVNGSAGASGNGAPSVEFIRWTKQALTGFKGDLDDFIQVLLSFPVDIPASNRAETLEIISDSVYANSSTLDGRRFAQDFYTKRKADAARPASSAGAKGGVAKIASLADVVKTQPVKKGDDFGFKVVKGKGKKKTT